MIASTDDIVSIDFVNPKNHLPHDDVSVGSSVFINDWKMVILLHEM